MFRLRRSPLGERCVTVSLIEPTPRTNQKSATVSKPSFFPRENAGRGISRRHFDVAVTNNLERQIEIESGDRAAIIPFGAEAQLPGQDCNCWIERFGLSALDAISGCQNGVALIFQKLCRMGNAVDCSFDPQNILFLRIFGSKDLACQCSRLGLALASEGVLARWCRLRLELAIPLE